MIQKFSETIFNTIKSINFIIFWYMWYIIQNVGEKIEMILLQLLPIFLKVRSLFNENRLLHKVRKTRLWKWIHKESFKMKRKMSNLLNQCYTSIIELPNVMWEIYILKPIYFVQTYLLTEHNDQTVEIYAYKVTSPLKAQIRPEQLEVDEIMFMTTLHEGAVVYSSINFSKYNQSKSKGSKLMRGFTITPGARKRTHVYIHSKSTLNLKKIYPLRNKMVVSCYDQRTIMRKIRKATSDPFQNEFLIALFVGYTLRFISMNIWYKYLIFCALMVRNIPAWFSFFFILYWLRLDRYITIVSNDTFNTY